MSDKSTKLWQDLIAALGEALEPIAKPELLTDVEMDYAIKLFLVHNQWHLQDLISPLLKQKIELYKSEPIEFHPMIHQEFLGLVKQALASEITKCLPVSAESVTIVLQSLNLNEYITRS